MASARWRIKAWIAPALAAIAAACVTPAPQSEAQAWADVRRAYAGRLAPNEGAVLLGAGSGRAADALSEQARERDDWAWESARRRDEAREYERYLREHRDGAHRMEAQRRLDRLRAGDEADWSRADLRDSVEAYQAYIANNPDGAYRDRASQRIRELRDRQFLAPLHRPRPTGMEAQPQRAPALPSGQPPATASPSERLRAAPLDRTRVAPVAPTAPLAPVAPAPVAPPAATATVGAPPPSTAQPSEPEASEPRRRRTAEPR